MTIIREDPVLLIDGQPHAGLLSIEATFDAKGALRKLVAGVNEAPPLTRRGAEAVLKDGFGVVMITGRVRRSYGDEAKPALRRFLEIESKACDAVECAADGRRHGYRIKGQKLGAAASTLFKPYAVPVKVEADSRSMDIAWAPGDRAFGVIEERARKAGLVMTGTADGGVALYRGVRGRHAGEFNVGGEKANATTLQFEDSERGQFSQTHYYGQRYKGGAGREETDGYAVVENEAMRRLRIDIRRAEHDADDADLKQRAEWDDRRAAGGDSGNGTQLVIATPSWRDDAGLLWEPAYVRYTVAPDFELDQDMAIKSVTFSWAKQHQLARLTMVEPATLGAKDVKGKSGKGWKVSQKSATYEELA